MKLDGNVLWGSGHRPNKLGPVDARLDEEISSYLRHENPDWVIAGMAFGFDLRLAKVAIGLGFSLCAAIPFKEHISKHPDYQFVLDMASLVHYVSPPGYAIWKFQVRNQWMVDNGTSGVTCWDGSRGGTDNCLKYARFKGSHYDNLWERCLVAK